MDDSALNTVVQRLDRLERRLRLWKIGVGAAALISLPIILLGASAGKPAQELRAQRFIVVNPDGKPVGEFSFREGISALTLSDASGPPRVVLSYGYETPGGLTLRDGKTTRADLSLRLDDSVALDLFDKQGKPRASVAIDSTGTPESTLRK